MSEYKTTCCRCDAEVTHVCSQDFVKEAIDIFRFVPEGGFPAQLKKGNPYLSKEDVAEIDTMPFFSETYLYALIGKEDARTVLAMINNFIRAAGLDPYGVEMRGYAVTVAKQRERETQDRRRESLRLRREAENKPLSERVVDKTKIYEYRSYTAFDNAVRKCEKAEHKTTEAMLTDERLVLVCSKCKVGHEVALPEVEKFIRYQCMSFERGRDFLNDTYFVSPLVKPVLEPLVKAAMVKIKAEAVPLREETLAKGKKRIIIATARALDETLYRAWAKMRTEIREKDPNDVRLSSMYASKAYGKPKIVDDVVVTELNGIEYGAPVEVLKTYERTETPDQRVFTSGFSQAVRLAKAGTEPAGSADEDW